MNYISKDIATCNEELKFIPLHSYLLEPPPPWIDKGAIIVDIFVFYYKILSLAPLGSKIGPPAGSEMCPNLGNLSLADVHVSAKSLNKEDFKLCLL